MTSDRKRRSLLSGVSHQLGQPLTVLKGTLEMALLGEPSLERHQAAIEEALEQTERLVSLAGLLREVASLEVLRQTENFADLTKPVEEVVRDMQPLAEARKVQLHLQCDSHLSVRCEAPHLRQTVMNLVDCCLRFTPENGSILVTVRQEGGEGCLEIRNVPSELSPDEWARMLHPFDAGYPAGSPEEKQTFSMAFCQRVAEILGGHIQVSPEKGGGIVLRFCLPAEQT